MKQSRQLTRTVSIAMMGSVGFVLQFFDFPLPLFPAFLKVDFSEVPALVSAIIFGPIAGVWVEGIKNIIHLLAKGSETGIPIGNIANFLAGSILAVTTGVFYKKMMSLKGVLYGLGVGTVLMAVIMSIANYFVFLPAYAYLLGWPLSSSDMLKMAFFAILPFNMVKGTILLVLMAPLYLRIRSFIDQKVDARAL